MVGARQRSLIWEPVENHFRLASRGMIYLKRCCRKMNLIVAQRRNEKENSSET